jgi:hypothetical protein
MLTKSINDTNNISFDNFRASRSNWPSASRKGRRPGLKISQPLINQNNDAMRCICPK